MFVPLLHKSKYPHLLVFLFSFTFTVSVNGENKNLFFQKQAGDTGRIEYFQKAGNLQGMNLRNQQEENIGFIDDVIMDNEQKNIYFVMISFKNKLYPVPWMVFDTSGAVYKLNIVKSDFLQAPSVDYIDLTVLSDNKYKKSIDDFYSEKISAKDENIKKRQMLQAYGSQTKPMLNRLNQVIGLDVQNLQGSELGELTDFIFDVRNGKIAYALVTFGGIWGLAGKTAVVPWGALRIQAENGVAKLDADQKILNSAVVTEKQLYLLTEPMFARKIHENFGIEPYWEVFGFVPGGQDGLAISGWQQDSNYNRIFDSSKMVLIEGVVTSVGTFQPETGAAPGIRLKVATKEGEVVNVHVGPLQYVSEQRVEFKSGEPIKITGSKVVIGFKPVIMASEIQVENKMLVLRDAAGKPQWKNEEIEIQKPVEKQIPELEQKFRRIEEKKTERLKV